MKQPGSYADQKKGFCCKILELDAILPRLLREECCIKLSGNILIISPILLVFLSSQFKFDLNILSCRGIALKLKLHFLMI